MNTSCCPCCGDTSWVSGTMQSTGTINFRPLGVKFMTFRTADIGITAKMCGKCGHISMVGNLEKLQLIQDTLIPDAVASNGTGQ